MKASLALLALLVAAVPASAQQAVKQRIAAPAQGVVEVHVLMGSVRVVGTGRSEVAVEGKIAPEEARLDLTQKGDRTTVRFVLPKGRHNRAGADLVVQVPKGSRVEVHTVTAPIEVSGVTGLIALKSVQGSIRLRDVKRPVLAETVTGDIAIVGAADSVRAKSMSGKLVVEQTEGALELSSVSGGVWVANARTAAGMIKSVSGPIEFTGAAGRDAQLHFANVSGRTEIQVSPRAAASFQVRSFSGDISNEFGAQAVRVSKYTSGKELVFTTGATGGTRFVVQSTSGDVHIKKQ